MKRCLTVVLTMAIIVAISTSAFGARLSYQGQLSDGAGDPAADGPYLVKFRLYDDPAAGSTLWDSDYRTVMVTNGTFAYTLGDTVDIPPTVFQNYSDVYLGIKVGSDPEMTPRTHLAYSGHSVMALKSLVADEAGHASNSDMLDGNMPSFYLEWSNITSVPAGFADGIDDTTSSLEWSSITSMPAGFADGVDDEATSLPWSDITAKPAGFADNVDDEGISEALDDANYLSQYGDSIRGNLFFDGTFDGGGGYLQIGPFWSTLNLATAGDVKSRLYGDSFGTLKLFDSDGSETVVLDARPSSGGELTLNNSGGGASIFLDGGATGDAAVLVPEEAINAVEMFNEPGIASRRNSNSLTVVTDSMRDLETISITTPAAGYIVLHGKCWIRTIGTTSSAGATVQFDETQGGLSNYPFYSRVGMAAFPSTGAYFYSVYATRIYYKSSAGTYTFRLEGQATSSNGTATSWDHIVTATYHPTSYGAVATFVTSADVGDYGSVESMESSREGPEGFESTEASFKVDLRELELRVQRERRETAEAEMALMKAQRDMERNNSLTDEQ